MKRVHESASNICPYCEYKHSETEGTSEMFESHCEIQCAECGRIYFYITDEPEVDKNGTLHIPHAEFAQSIMTYNSGGGCMLDEIELDTGEILIISDDAIGIYDTRATWEEGDGESLTMERREARLTSRCEKCNHIYKKDHEAQTICPKCTREYGSFK